MKTEKKEFILQAHRDACRGYKKGIEKHWPKLFPKEDFKVGDWVVLKNRTNCIYRIDEFDGVYWCGEVFGSGYPSSEIRKATKQEIESHLIEEAKRRGLDKGGFKCLYHGKLDPGGIMPVYVPDEDRLWNEYGCCYCKGQWAEITDDTPKDIQQLVEKYGKEELKKWL